MVSFDCNKSDSEELEEMFDGLKIDESKINTDTNEIDLDKSQQQKAKEILKKSFQILGKGVRKAYLQFGGTVAAVASVIAFATTPQFGLSVGGVAASLATGFLTGVGMTVGGAIGIVGGPIALGAAGLAIGAVISPFVRNKVDVILGSAMIGAMLGVPVGPVSGAIIGAKVSYDKSKEMLIEKIDDMEAKKSFNKVSEKMDKIFDMSAYDNANTVRLSYKKEA